MSLYFHVYLVIRPYTSTCTMYNVIYFLFLQQSDVTLQMVFFDGEEALVRWTKTDSLYGARHLAEKWSNTRHPNGSNTTMIDTIVSILFFMAQGVKHWKCTELRCESNIN